jgi:hypothetical protein
MIGKARRRLVKHARAPLESFIESGIPPMQAGEMPEI